MSIRHPHQHAGADFVQKSTFAKLCCLTLTVSIVADGVQALAPVYYLASASPNMNSTTTEKQGETGLPARGLPGKKQPDQ